MRLEPASANVLIAATCLQSQWWRWWWWWWWRLWCFYLLRLSCTVSWNPAGSLASISLAWAIGHHHRSYHTLHIPTISSLYPAHHQQRTIPPSSKCWLAHSWVAPVCSLLQTGCGKRSGLGFVFTFQDQCKFWTYLDIKRVQDRWFDYHGILGYISYFWPKRKKCLV